MLRLIATLLGIIALSGCAHVGPRGSTEIVPGEWSTGVRATARKTYAYAQMSMNAYRDGEHFNLPPELVEIDRRDNNRRGFAYAVFERREAGQQAEIIIAFRGTEPMSWRDWLIGNALARQNPQGLAVYDAWRARIPDGVPITVTGHSLGGAIATYVSLCRSSVNSYIFNSSPRFSRCAGDHGPAGDRESVVEYGEFLKLARIFGRSPDQLYTSIGCRSGNPFAQHSMRSLAECLTQIAAIDDPGARASRERNRMTARPYSEASPVR